MVSFQKCVYMNNDNGEPVYYGEGTCISADTKPTGMANGSSLIEMDTGKILMYDAENELWRELT